MHSATLCLIVAMYHHVRSAMARCTYGVVRKHHGPNGGYVYPHRRTRSSDTIHTPRWRILGSTNEEVQGRDPPYYTLRLVVVVETHQPHHCTGYQRSPYAWTAVVTDSTTSHGLTYTITVMVYETRSRSYPVHRWWILGSSTRGTGKTHSTPYQCTVSQREHVAWMV